MNNFWTGLALGLNCSLCLVPLAILLIMVAMSASLWKKEQ